MVDLEEHWAQWDNTHKQSMQLDNDNNTNNTMANMVDLHLQLSSLGTGTTDSQHTERATPGRFGLAGNQNKCEDSKLDIASETIILSYRRSARI
jgi:hypothetical protein